MTDLIRREDAIDALNQCDDIRGYAYRQMHDALMEIPSVKPSDVDCWGCKCGKIEPKQGKWIVYEGEWKDFDYYCPKCKCNQCGYEEELYILNAKPTNFCPNCGADMRKGADDEMR